MTTIDSSNALGRMLNNAFSKFDRDGDAKLNPEEFSSFNEILKPGIAVDRNDHPTVDYSKTMDRDANGVVTRDEMYRGPHARQADRRQSQDDSELLVP